MVALPVCVPSSPESVLACSPMPEIRRLVVVEDDDVVIIMGTVSSYYLKQMAQEAVRSTVGQRKMQNRVEVLR